MVEITKEKLKNGTPMILRWSGSPYPNDSVYATNAGWRLPETMDTFFTRIDEKTSIIKDARLIRMNELDLDLQYLRTNMELQDLRRIQGYADDADYIPRSQIQDITAFDESTPKFLKNSLHVTRGVAYTEVAETFIDENLEKSNFLSKSGSLYMQQLGLDIEKVGLMARANPTRPNRRSMMDSMDGIFQQLKDVDARYETGTDNPKGFGSAFSLGNGSVIKQVMDKIDEFMAQNGNLNGAKFYVSKVLNNRILREVTTRETDWADHVLRDGYNMSILGVPIVVVDCLNPLSDPRKRNYWNHLALLAEPTSMIWGVYKDIESKTSYQHRYLNYLTTWQVAFDTGILWEQDLLAFDVLDEATGKFVITVEDSAKTPIEGATVEIYDKESNNPDEPVLPAGTTNGSGVVEFEGLKYGKYLIKVTADEYKDNEIADVILNEEIETETIKMKKA